MKKGFTLIETILVVGTFALLFVISVPLYQSFQVRNSFHVTVDSIIQSLQRAQTRAVYMEQDSDWGVKIVTDGSDKLQNVTVFKGNDFTLRDAEYDEVFYGSSAIEVTGDTELVFNKFSGELSVVSASINVAAAQIGEIQRVININKKGTITAIVPQLPPSVVTVAASALGSTAATLNGTGDPNSATSTGWFRYDTINPGTCNDTFGTKVPASGTDLGAGNSAVAYNEDLTGLTSSTTYYFCAIASNSAGTSFGSVLSFLTPIAPSVTTAAATSITSSTAILNGSSNPNGASTTGWFRYDTTNPGTCNDTFGTRVPASGGTALGAGTSGVAFDESLTGLSSSATYYFCALASNSVGTSLGSVLSFTTSAGAPAISTSAATGITTSSATLNGTGNPNGASTTGWFRYRSTVSATCLDDDSWGIRVPASGGTALGSGTSAQSFDEGITGLTDGATYYFCAIGSNSAGTSLGSVLSFDVVPIIGTWTQRTSGTTTNIQAIAYSPVLGTSGRFVIGMANGTNKYSDDGGVTWLNGTTVPLGAGGSSPIIQNLEWSDNYDLFIATGTQVIATNTTAAVWTSGDGITWSTPTTLSGSSALAIADGGTTLISGSSNSTGGNTGRSSDGVTWTTGGPAADARHTGAAWSPTPILGIFVLVSEGGFIDTSVDGVAWTAQDSGTSASFAHVAYSPTLDKFLAVTMTGTSRTSTDGATWTAGSTGVAAANTDKTRWISNMFLSSTSTAGRFDRRDTPTSTVRVVTTGATTAPYDIATNGNVVVAVHAGGQIYTAPLND